jgi:hypothetical protein
MSKTYTYEHKGFALQQWSDNWHYMIFEIETGQRCIHVPCTKKLTIQEAIDNIERYIKMIY